MKCVDFVGNASNRVLIERQSLVDDDVGGFTNTWTTVGTYWAWVMPLSTSESVQNEQLRGTTTHKVIIRYQSALANVKTTSSYRLTLDSRTHQIKGIKNLDAELKNYGKAFQELLTDENAVELDG